MTRVEIFDSSKFVQAELESFLINNFQAPYDNPEIVFSIIMRSIKSNRDIMDVFVNGERFAIALILSSFLSRSNSVELVIPGIRRLSNTDDIFRIIFESALKRLADSRISALDFYRADDSAISQEVLEEIGFLPVFETVKMCGNRIQMKQCLDDLSKIENPFQWRDIDASTAKEFVKVFEQTFLQNPETYFVSEEDLINMALNSHIPVRLLMDEGKVIAFSWVGIRSENEGEIQYVGVLPSHRNKNLGGIVLRESVRLLLNEKIGITSGHFNTKNIAAVKLFSKYSVTAANFTLYRKQTTQS